jgi:hypothetical protein
MVSRRGGGERILTKVVSATSSSAATWRRSERRSHPAAGVTFPKELLPTRLSCVQGRKSASWRGSADSAGSGTPATNVAIAFLATQARPPRTSGQGGAERRGRGHRPPSLARHHILRKLDVRAGQRWAIDRRGATSIWVQEEIHSLAPERFSGNQPFRRNIKTSASAARKRWSNTKERPDAFTTQNSAPFARRCIGTRQHLAPHRRGGLSGPSRRLSNPARGRSSGHRHSAPVNLAADISRKAEFCSEGPS